MEAHEVRDPAAAEAIAAAGQTARRVIENVGRVIRAPELLLERCLLALLCEGHVILEDFPGVGKTMLAKSLARSLDCEFARIQATPDLLPSDITGVNVFNMQSNEFEFQRSAAAHSEREQGTDSGQKGDHAHDGMGREQETLYLLDVWEF